jgi:glycosyltransferase involved in cell wall biosynthesis
VRICFLSTVHTARDKRVFEKEAVSLAEAGHDVVHLCPGDEPETVERGVRIVTYTPAHGLLRRSLGLVSLYRRARAIGAGCYHCNEVDSWLVGVALKILGRLRRQASAGQGRPLLVFDVHETFPHDLAEFHAPRALRPAVVAAVRALFRVLVPFTDKLVLAKHSVAVDFPGAEAKQILVQNFVPLRLLAHGAATAPIRASSAAVTAVHVGLISRVRGWPVLLDALASGEAAGVHLTVIGEFNDGSQSDFEARVAELGLGARVRTVGWLAATDAFREVERADIGLVMFQPGFRSHTDSLPHKLFDYMLAGLPVIVPDFGAVVAGIVRDAGCGLLVDPSDSGAVATALGTLARNPAERRRMGANGRRSVLEKYNWEAEAKQLVAMYAAFAGDGRRST